MGTQREMRRQRDLGNFKCYTPYSLKHDIYYEIVIGANLVNLIFRGNLLENPLNLLFCAETTDVSRWG